MSHDLPKPSLQEAQQALFCISPDIPRDQWVTTGMAMKSAFGESAFEAWDHWSQGGQSYEHRSTQETWKSISPDGGITIASLFKMAKDCGYKGELRKVSGPQATIPTPKQKKLQAPNVNAKENLQFLQSTVEADTDHNHPYLKRKSVPAMGLRIDQEGHLVLPLIDRQRNLVAYQKFGIPDGDGYICKASRGGLGESLFLYGDPPNHSVIYLGEGYATAASVGLVTGKPFAVACGVKRLSIVGRQLRAMFPEAKIVFLADDDIEAGKPNVGLEGAKSAASEIGGYVAVPEISGIPNTRKTDFNDLYLEHGAKAVIEALSIAAKPDKVASVESAMTYLDLALTANKTIISNLDNAVRCLEHHPELKSRIWFDDFLQAVRTDWQGEIRNWTDRDTSMLTVYLQRHIGLQKISTSLTHEAVMCAAFNDIRNEVKSYIESSAWDGIERLPEMMAKGFGAELNDYTSAVGRCWMVSMVARVFNPGCQVDTVPVFEGKQGIRKSSALRAIGGKWFTESHESVTSKDFFMVMQGNLLIEIAEMHSFNKAEVNRIKGVITNRFDRYRRPYGRVVEDNPRMSVFACTTNEREWQKDDTGGRRFLPISCSSIDITWLEMNRDQLFAEALRRFKNGESWWDIPSEAHENELRGRAITDSWDEAVNAYLSGRRSTTVADILQYAIDIPLSHQDMVSQKRIGSILRKLKWQNKNGRLNGKQTTVWVPEGEMK